MPPPSRSLFEIFLGALGGFPDSGGWGGETRAAERGGPVARASRGKSPGFAEARTEARTYSTSLPTPLLSSFRCAFSDMRRLLEPCWWILFLKITSSVLHYVVCFPGECWPPRGTRPRAARAGDAELSPGHGASAPVPGTPERVEVGGGLALGIERGIRSVGWLWRL